MNCQKVLTLRHSKSERGFHFLHRWMIVLAILLSPQMSSLKRGEDRRRTKACMCGRARDVMYAPNLRGGWMGNFLMSSMFPRFEMHLKPIWGAFQRAKQRSRTVKAALLSLCTQSRLCPATSARRPPPQAGRTPLFALPNSNLIAC
jgi:hypothetical protein